MEIIKLLLLSYPTIIIFSLTTQSMESKHLILLAGTLLQNDRSFQYRSHVYHNFIEDYKIIQSLSRVGKCIDNRPPDNFLKIIKYEMYQLKI